MSTDNNYKKSQNTFETFGIFKFKENTIIKL